MSLFAGSLTTGHLLNGGLGNGGLFARNAAFITTWDTTKAGVTGSTSIRLPLVSGVAYNFVVDWGDGSSETVTSSAISSKDHTYSVGGIYTVTISGTFQRIYFNDGGDKLKLLTIENLGAVGWTSFNGAFYGCSNNTKCAGYVDWGSTTDLTNAWRGNQLTSWTTPLPASLTNCSNAWYGNQLTSWTVDLPASLASCSHAWRNNHLTSWTIPLPASLTNCIGAWQYNQITSWTGGGWAGVTDASNALYSGTNAINTTDYNALLVTIEANNQNNNVPFHFGNSKHSGAGTVARAALIADHGDTITDGGPA